MGGGHDRHIGLPGEHVPITDINPIHKNVAYLGMVTMFAWVLIRFKEEGLVLLVSWSVGMYFFAGAMTFVVRQIHRYFEHQRPKPAGCSAASRLSIGGETGVRPARTPRAHLVNVLSGYAAVLTIL